MNNLLRIRHRTYKAYSGPHIINRGGGSVPPGIAQSHFEQAAWLTAAVECSARAGTVVAYDGTGATAGLFQDIAVYPRAVTQGVGGQGGLWRLVYDAIACLPATDAVVTTVQALMRRAGWVFGYATTISVLQEESRAPVSGAVIQDVLTPFDGVVPTRGVQWEQSVEWASAFSELFAHPSTYPLQFKSGTNAIARASTRYPEFKSFYGGEEIQKGSVLDFNLCVWWSYWVNAPSIARKTYGEARGTGTTIIQALGNSGWGRWNRNIPGGRYQRTRKRALASGYWEKGVIDASMP
jgi:hypothetical protein